MKKLLSLMVVLVLGSALVVTGCGNNKDEDYNYLTPEELNTRLQTGDLENGSMVMITTQTEEEYASGHLPDATATYARPLESDEDYAKLDSFLSQVMDTDEDIILICPRGKSGAERPYDYFVENGVSEDRLLILEEGQESYNEAFPEDVNF